MGFEKRYRRWLPKGMLCAAPWVSACDDGTASEASGLEAATRSLDLGSAETEPNLPNGIPSIELSGDLRVHDPALIRARQGDWVVFSTGDAAVGAGTVQIRRSSNLSEWAFVGTVFSSIPDWVREAVPDVQNLWAPDVIEHAGEYFLYYSASTFGSNTSVIGLATNQTLDPSSADYRWVDRGLVARSSPEDDYNAIDPSVIVDTEGRPWMAFGSFWSGIRMLELEWPNGTPAPDPAEPLRLADRFVPPNAVEAPALMYRGGWYYLFVSFDFCCQGLSSTYKIAVGRAREVTGPYFDRLGTPLAHGGGTVILSEREDMFGPGGQSVYGGMLVHHFYDRRANGDFRLGLRRLEWEVGDWPRVARR
jgi:arabinan endo-1,5-alpha-L-arabinosidase